MHAKASFPCGEPYEVRINWFAEARNNHLFNEPRFFQMHADSAEDFYAQLTRISDQHVLATIAFYAAESKRFVSPRRGTFGGLSLNAPLDLEDIESFLRSVIAYTRSLGATTLEVRQAPASHDPGLWSSVANYLLRNDWDVLSTDLNYQLQVTATPLIERVNHGNAKRIRKCIREGFVSEMLEPSQLPLVFAVIAENRFRRRKPLSMTFDQISAMASKFPEAIRLFGVYRDSTRVELVASAICFSVQAGILYVFYWGDVTGMETYSPIALLAATIYTFCQSEGIALLDVGTSTEKGIPNLGLVRFKRSLGFSESLKLSFVTHFSDRA